ncbi:hypothetical protein BPIT_28200 [Candidatus Brocadia pituitae]|nr:hypothetical protein BPIT_28200 [Candidatus Brocadia pituitae]
MLHRLRAATGIDGIRKPIAAAGASFFDQNPRKIRKKNFSLKGVVPEQSTPFLFPVDFHTFTFKIP